MRCVSQAGNLLFWPVLSLVVGISVVINFLAVFRAWNHERHMEIAREGDHP